MMKLAELIKNIPVQIRADEYWSVVGSDTDMFRKRLKVDESQFIPFNKNRIAEIKGLLLAEVLSTMPMSHIWLTQLVDTIAEGTTLVVVEWQDDGPPNYGPELEMRFKKGRLNRLLRQSGFGQIVTLDHHPVYYIIKAVKGPASEMPHAGQFVEVASLDELSRNTMKTAEIFGHQIIVANTGKEIVAFARACPHASGPFDQGLLRGRNVICPLHAYIWNVRTGEPVNPDDEDILPRYSVKIDTDSGRVWVALTSPIS